MTLFIRGQVGKRLWIKWHFLVCNRSKICWTGRHTPTKNSQEHPPSLRNLTSLALLLSDRGSVNFSAFYKIKLCLKPKKIGWSRRLVSNIDLVSFNMIDVKTIVFNVSFFNRATDMYWCLIGNSGSITSKLSIIAINPGHFLCKNLEGDDFRGFIVAMPTFHHFHLRSAHHSVWSFAILYLLFMSLDKKMHLCTNLLPGK